MDGEVALRLRIRGRVQGVGYRDWAVRAARRLGVGGWVRNLADGSVEVVAQGARNAVDAFVAACRTGPPSARVTGVDTAPAALLSNAGFQQLPTASPQD